jgi:hypothetical protein
MLPERVPQIDLVATFGQREDFLFFRLAGGEAAPVQERYLFLQIHSHINETATAGQDEFAFQLATNKEVVAGELRFQPNVQWLLDTDVQPGPERVVRGYGLIDPDPALPLELAQIDFQHSRKR